MPRLATCPSCSATLRIPDAIIKPEITCPRCLAPVENPAAAAPPIAPAAASGRLAEEEASLDSRRTSVFLILLAVLGGLGLIPQVFGAIAQAFSQGDFTLLLFTTGGILFLMLISAVIVFMRSRGNPRARGFGRIVVGTLALAGGLMVLGFLAGLAFLVYILVVCSNMGGRF